MKCFQVCTGKGKTITETWHRCIKIDGAYLFDHGENIEAYFKAVGYANANAMDALKHYKMHVSKKGDQFCTKEWFDGHLIANSFTLDVEGPVRYPDDKEGNFKGPTFLLKAFFSMLFKVF